MAGRVPKLFGAVVLGALLLLACGPAACLARDEVNFDFGWRFRLGATAPPAPPPAPSKPKGCAGQFAFTNASASQCDGLQNTASATTAEACEQACCNDNSCGVWQFSTEATGGGCWRGLCTGPMNHDPAWVGGQRAPPIQPPAPAPPIGPDPPEAQPGYNDSTADWTTVNAPHDALIAAAPSLELCPDGCSGHSYIPRYPSWYRKHFQLPAAWEGGSAIYLYFGATFRETTLWVNGVNVSTHESGYTSYGLRLDNIPGLKFGAGNDNVIALYMDPNIGRSGWWYEGSGLYRHVRLVRTDITASIAPDGLFAFSNISNISGSNGHLVAGSAVLHVSAELHNLQASGATTKGVSVTFTLRDATGAQVATAVSSPVDVPPTDMSIENATKVTAKLDALSNVALWQIQNPVLYQLTAEVAVSGSAADPVVDAVNITTGFRSLRYDAAQGMFLNDQYTKVRGFCDHNDFASFGMAVPDRVKLFRAQASRSVGGNGRRTSHNAPDPVMLDIYDRLGVAVMDENRQIFNDSQHIGDMRDLVHRDRNHPSVTIWSFCNEAGCESAVNQAGGPAFQEVTYAMDGSRPTLANMFTFGDLLSKTIDVQGFSHQPRSKVDAAHAAYPDKPIYMSECCSCNTMRGEDVSAGGLQESFNAQCQQEQTNASNGVDYVMGTMVWTLFDYYGEPSNGGWPFVSSTFGAFDLAGFAKAASYWFRSQWLYAIPDSASDKTFKTDTLPGPGSAMVHIVERWQPPGPAPPVPAAANRSYIGACDGTVRQKITFSGSDDGATPGTIQSAEQLCLSTKCADSTGSDCYPLPFVACNATDQDQLLTRVPGQPGVLRSVSSTNPHGGCLDVFGGPTPDRGQRVGLYTCDGGANQQWIVNGSTLVENVSSPDYPSGFCLSTATTDIAPVSSKRTIHVYSSAPFVELFVNGVSQGIQGIVSATAGGDSFATFSGLEFAPGNLTALARSMNSTSARVLATHSVLTSGPAAKLALSLDVPSIATGTGAALVLDGQDAGLVRCEIQDASGLLAHDSNATVTFRVVNGPGRIVGVHSGNPQSHEHNQNSTHSAYHGLVRAAVMVTSDAAVQGSARELRDFVDGSIDLASAAAPPGGLAQSFFTVEASSPGLGVASIQVPVSLDAEFNSVLAVASTFGSQPVLGFD